MKVINVNQVVKCSSTAEFMRNRAAGMSLTRALMIANDRLKFAGVPNRANKS